MEPGTTLYHKKNNTNITPHEITRKHSLTFFLHRSYKSTDATRSQLHSSDRRLEWKVMRQPSFIKTHVQVIFNSPLYLGLHKEKTGAINFRTLYKKSSSF